jgi:hypothetical protein
MTTDSLLEELEAKDAHIEHMRIALEACVAAITGHLSLAYSASESALQLREAREQAREALK